MPRAHAGPISSGTHGEVFVATATVSTDAVIDLTSNAVVERVHRLMQGRVGEQVQPPYRLLDVLGVLVGRNSPPVVRRLHIHHLRFYTTARVTDHRRQRHRGCQGRIPGNIWSAGDEMSSIPPKFVKIVIKLPAELMRTVQRAFAVQGRDQHSQRESDISYFARALTSSTTHF